MLVPESLLQGMKRAALGEPFDREDFVTVNLRREHRARLGRLPIQNHRAGAANRGLTADMCPGETENVSYVVNQQKSRFNFGLMRNSVDGDSNRFFH